MRALNTAETGLDGWAMETTRMPLRLSMDFKATECSRLRVKCLNFQTNIALDGALGLGGLVQHIPELGPVGYPSAFGLVECTRGPRGIRSSRRNP